MTIAVPAIAHTIRVDTKISRSWTSDVSRGTMVFNGIFTTVYAVQSKQLYGAILDVCEKEPLPKEHPLWKEQNVIITPHISGTFQLEESFVRFADIALYNLNAFLEKKQLRNVVDLQRGYRIHTVPEKGID